MDFLAGACPVTCCPPKHILYFYFLGDFHPLCCVVDLPLTFSSFADMLPALPALSNSQEVSPRALV